MAILEMHSFDYSTNYWDYNIVGSTGGTHAIVASGARSGSQCLELHDYSAFGITGRVHWSIQNLSTVWTQAAFKVTWTFPKPVTDDNYGVIWFCEGSTDADAHVRVGFDMNTLQCVVTRDKTEILRSSTGNLITYGTWHFIEAKVTVHDSTGSVLVKVDGVTVINSTGIDTRAAKTGVINRLMWCTGVGVNGGRAYLDDLLIGDATGSITSPPGDARVEYLVPIANGDRVQFTPLSGNNWSNVDDIGTLNDSDYNSSPDTGATDLFSMSNLTGNGIVHAVQSVVRCRKDDVGYRLMKPMFYKEIGTGVTPRLYEGAQVSVPDSFTYKRQVFGTSPDTGTAWTVEEVADLQFGYAVGGGSQFSADAWVVEF